MASPLDAFLLYGEFENNVRGHLKGKQRDITRRTVFSFCGNSTKFQCGYFQSDVQGMRETRYLDSNTRRKITHDPPRSVDGEYRTDPGMKASE